MFSTPGASVVAGQGQGQGPGLGNIEGGGATVDTPPGLNMPTGIAQSKPQPRPLTPDKKKQGQTEKTLPGPGLGLGLELASGPGLASGLGLVSPERSPPNIPLSGKDSIPEPTSPVHIPYPHIYPSKQTEPQYPVSASTFYMIRHACGLVGGGRVGEG